MIFVNADTFFPRPGLTTSGSASRFSFQAHSGNSLTFWPTEKLKALLPIQPPVGGKYLRALFGFGGDKSYPRTATNRSLNNRARASLSTCLVSTGQPSFSNSDSN